MKKKGFYKIVFKKTLNFNAVPFPLSLLQLQRGKNTPKGTKVELWQIL